jgi:DtxR family Mn-dependent transcriptional regulator
MQRIPETDAADLSHSAAHHLVAIHELGAAYGGWARVSDIARRLHLTRGSVSITLRGLRRRGLVTSDEHRMVRLTPPGEQIALAVASRKTTLHAFFTQVLNLPAGPAEADSCRMEHLVSEETGNRLARFVQIMTSDDAAARKVRERFEKEAP